MTLEGEEVAAAEENGETVVGEEELYAQKARIRGVHQGPDGALYLVDPVTLEPVNTLRSMTQRLMPSALI